MNLRFPVIAGNLCVGIKQPGNCSRRKNRKAAGDCQNPVAAVRLIAQDKIIVFTSQHGGYETRKLDPLCLLKVHPVITGKRFTYRSIRLCAHQTVRKDAGRLSL